MIQIANALSYIAQVIGKPVIAIYNDCENQWYYFLIDTFKPCNPSNHIHENELSGKNLQGILTSFHGFSAGFQTTTDPALMTAVDALPVQLITFVGFKWIKFSK